MEEVEEVNLNVVFVFLEVLLDLILWDEEVKIILDSIVCSIEDED